MNPRSPTVTLTPEEGERVRNVVKARGIAAAVQVLGNIDARTLSKAAAEMPIARLSAQVIRFSLERI
jgi:hypothetical protein